MSKHPIIAIGVQAYTLSEPDRIIVGILRREGSRHREAAKHYYPSMASLRRAQRAQIQLLEASHD